MTNETLAPATIELLRKIYEAKDSKLLKTEIDLDDEKLSQRLNQLLTQELISPSDAEVITRRLGAGFMLPRTSNVS